MAKLPLIPLDLPPGVVRNGTPYQVKGRWFDASQVRWLDNIMQPIGGWAAITTTPLAHPARGMKAWTTNSGVRYYAVGTSTQLIVGDGSATTWDVTPTGFTAGNDNGSNQAGYGGGNYQGGNGYGTPGSGPYMPPMTWQMDMWGDNLVACAAGDGVAYQWALNTSTKAATIAGAPTGNTGLLVTEQQHLMLIGAGGNRRLVQWSDVDNNTVWTPAATNEAGQFPLVTSGTLQRGVRVRGQVLLLTDIDAWVGSYLGQPLIWGFSKAGGECGLIAPNAIVEAGGAAFWMSDKRFWFYDGATVQELPCDVANYVFNNLNPAQIGKIYAGSNGLFEEVWWHYPSLTSTEPDQYVSYNYRNGFWMIGALGRTAWVDRGAFPTPMAVGSDGYIYNHEEGMLANGATRFAGIYAVTGALEPQQLRAGVASPYSSGGGDKIVDVNQVITDEQTIGDTQLTFIGSFTPNGQQFTYGPYLVRSDGYMDTRAAGRQFQLKVQPTSDAYWQIGQLRLDCSTSGGR